MTDPTSETTWEWNNLFGKGMAEFLLARIAEDEAAARAVGPTRYYVHDFPGGGVAANEAGDILVEVDGGAPLAVQALFDHNARHQSGRVLAECEAKRRIIAAHSRDELDAFTGSWEMRVMAIVYADHPDYRDEWKP